MKKEKLNVFLDDSRDTPEDFQIRTYTYNETIEVLDKMEGHIGILSLDNDLGTSEEGYDVMKWIEKRYHTKGYILPDKILIHSTNPIAKHNMEAIINKLYRLENERKY